MKYIQTSRGDIRSPSAIDMGIVAVGWVISQGWPKGIVDDRDLKNPSTLANGQK